MKRQVFMYCFLVNSLLFAKFVSTALLIVIQGSTVDCHSFFYLFIFFQQNMSLWVQSNAEPHLGDG